MFGTSFRYFDLTVGGMILSSMGDSVLNLHVTPTALPGKLRFGLGVQDAFSTGGSSGELLDKRGDAGSRSFYAVTTAELKPGCYVSLGTGTRRFQGLFGNVSAPLGSHARIVAEYDRFNWNFGVAGTLGPVRLVPRRAERFETTMFLGLIRGKYAIWSINFTF